MKTFLSFINRSTSGPHIGALGLRGLALSISCSAALFSILSGRLIAQDTPPETAAPAVEAEIFTPREYPIDRYQKLRGKSPFEFELAKPVVVDAADPFADLVLAGYAGSASRPTVYVLNTKTQERITILPDGNSKKESTGFRVLSVNRGRNLATTTVKVEKNGVQKELAFDPKSLSSMTAGATGGQPGTAPGVRPGVPGQPGQPGMVPGARPGQPAVAAYKAPQAFIPGQNNRNGNPASANLAGGNMAAGVQLGMQPNANANSTDAQQQLNALLNSSNGQPPQPTVIPAVPGSQAGQVATPQPRRRVVLPTTP